VPLLPRSLALVLFGLLSALPAAKARAEMFEVYGQIHAGGGFGRGSAGAPSKDFFELVQGASAGGELGVEIYNVDVFVDHSQFFDSRLSGSWTQFMVGLDAAFPMDDDKTTLGTIGIDTGFGLGILERHAQGNSVGVSRKGAAAEVRLQGDRLLGKYAAIGLDLRVGYHYLFDAQAASAASRSHGIHLLGGVALKVHFDVY
jgi:hypothetical protein